MNDDSGETAESGHQPQIDSRRRDELSETVEEMLPYYVEAYDPDEGDIGATLLTLFAELTEEVTERLDQVPKKHRIAFYDRLGFSRQPPQPARAPLSVAVADRAGENVTVPAGTVATAEPEDGPEQPFEVPEGNTFDATPANLDTVFSVDGNADDIYAHHDAVGGEAASTLFVPETAENLQQHAFYIGDEKQLAVSSDSALTVEIETDADPETLRGLDWEYYGEITEGDEKITKWHAFDEITASRAGSRVELSFTFEGTLKKKTVSGTETTWLRGLIPDSVEDEELAELFGLRIGRVGSAAPPVEVGARDGQGYLTPDTMLHNDVPQPVRVRYFPEIYPFGEQPREQDTFYLSSTDALTKSGAEVTVSFYPLLLGSGDPVLSWEYYDGEGWSRIPGLSDDTNGFQVFGTFDDPETVSFEVPPDLAKTTVAGHEGHWIRVRLVSGDYGRVQFEPVDTDGDGVDDRYEQRTDNIDAPVFWGVEIEYDRTGPPDHAVTENNISFERVPVESGSYVPFQELSVDGQALYAGFDGSLADGPINLLVDLEDTAYSQTFRPQVRWEYEHSDEGWTRPTVRDGTEGLTKRGIVGLTFPETTESTALFGRERHWVRARVTNDQFGLESVPLDVLGLRGTATEPEPCGRTVETVPPAGEPVRAPPDLDGLYPNAVWARNRETVASEVLGSSDGSTDQTFATAKRPVVDPTVWVDELAVRSEGERQRLTAAYPDRTETETDDSGEMTAFWVKWGRQPDLLDSGADDRHYTLNPIAGMVTFGDGTRGAVLPRGSDNVRASYATGGGAAGNVPAGAVSGFRQSLAYVDSVTNPLPGGAGADAEATDAVTDRAARQLRDRDRAVAPADYERIATDASRQLARAKCLPAMDRAGNYEPGWVTLLIVPDSPVTKPRPSATLRQDVERAVAAKAPAIPVGLDQIEVRGPSYVTTTVDVEVEATGGSIARLEERVHEALDSFLHPLTGGPDGEGWPFGTLPCRSDFYELLEGVDRVDHVVELALSFEPSGTTGSTVTVAEGEATPDTSPDALVHSGEHTVVGTMVGGGG